MEAGSPGICLREETDSGPELPGREGGGATSLPPSTRRGYLGPEEERRVGSQIRDPGEGIPRGLLSWFRVGRGVPRAETSSSEGAEGSGPGLPDSEGRGSWGPGLLWMKEMRG